MQPLILPCSPFVLVWLRFSLQIRCIFCAFPFVTENGHKNVQKQLWIQSSKTAQLYCAIYSPRYIRIALGSFLRYS